MNLVEIIVFVLLAKSFVQNLYVLYLLQFNEYRLDRFRGYIKRTFGSALLALPYITVLAPTSLKKLPKPTGKAFVLMVLTLILHVFVFINVGIVEVALLTLLVTPFIQIALVLLFFPFEWVVRKTIYSMARHKISQLQKNGLAVVGITGSYGKSSTKYFLKHLVSPHLKTVTSEGSINSPLALSLIILKHLHASHRLFIVEMGAYKKGEIAELARITQPHVGIITGISDQHIELFGSQKNIIEAKSELINSLPDDSIAFINTTSEFQPIVKGKNITIVGFGDDETNRRLQPLLTTALIPNFLKINLQPAILVAEHLKIPTQDIKKSLFTLPLPPKTMTAGTGYEGCTYIDDSFSSNTKGAIAAIQELIDHKNKQKIIIMTCLIELGENAEGAHGAIGELLARNNITTLITTNECFRTIQSMFSHQKMALCMLKTNPADVVTWLSDKLTDDSVVLLEGKINPEIINFIEKS